MTAPTIETRIWLALKSRIESLPLAYDKAWPAEMYQPDATKPFLRIGKVQTAPVRQMIADGKPHERSGSLIITLVHPLGYPVTVFEQLQGLIAEHFKDGTRMTYADLCVSVPSYPHCIEGYLDYGWWNAPVSIPWRCFA